MRLNFSKMHGLGNDFVVIDGITQAANLAPDQIRFLADRHFGIGCDQVLLVERPESPAADFRYRIFNADGGEVQQCGNGARCFARFVLEKELTSKHEIAVETAGGLIRPRIEPTGAVTVNMGVPRLEPSEIPFIADERATTYAIEAAGRSYEIGAVSMGNPHAVMRVDDTEKAAVAEIGSLIEKHQRFPERVNVGFMQVESKSRILLRVFERGAGETLACGTGACAAVVWGRLQGLLGDEVTVVLPGGALSIRWEGEGKPVWMSGPATFVFEGTIDL